MKIIVTGGAGFIGGNFVHYMLNKYPEYEILCVDCLTYAGNMETLAPVMENEKFHFFKIDITNRDAIYELFEKESPDVVVNFAAESAANVLITLVIAAVYMLALILVMFKAKRKTKEPR